MTDDEVWAGSKLRPEIVPAKSARVRLWKGNVLMAWGGTVERGQQMADVFGWTLESRRGAEEESDD